MALVVAVVSSFFVLTSPPLTASAQPAPTVVLVDRGDLGSVLSDPDGWTLYTWDGDAEGMSNCFDACADAWPPYTIDSDLVPPDDLPASLGLIDRGDGSWQVTIDNWPLYYFSQDMLPGDINGNLVNGFGATWYIMAYSPPAPPVVVVQPAPAPVVPAQPAPAVPAPIVTSAPVVAMPVATPAPARQTAQVNPELRIPTRNDQHSGRGHGQLDQQRPNGAYRDR